MEVPDLDFRRRIHCLTCDMGVDCRFNDGKFSANGRYVVLECLGPGVPRTELRSVADNKLIEVLNTNPQLEDWTSRHTLPRVRQMSIPLLSGGEAHVQLLLPTILVESELSKFPLVVEL